MPSKVPIARRSSRLWLFLSLVSCLLLAASAGTAAPVELSGSARAGLGYDSNIYYGTAQLAELAVEQAALVEFAPSITLGLVGERLRFDAEYGALLRQALAGDGGRHELALDHTLELRLGGVATRGLHSEVLLGLTQLYWRDEAQAGWWGGGVGFLLGWGWGPDRRLSLDYTLSSLWYREGTREFRQAVRAMLRWSVAGLAIVFGYPLGTLIARPNAFEHGPQLEVGWGLAGLPIKVLLGYQLAIQHVLDAPRRVDIYHMPRVELTWQFAGRFAVLARYASTIEPGGRQHLASLGLSVSLEWQSAVPPVAGQQERLRELLAAAPLAALERERLLELLGRDVSERAVQLLGRALALEIGKVLVRELGRRRRAGQSVEAALQAIVEQARHRGSSGVRGRRRR